MTDLRFLIAKQLMNTDCVWSDCSSFLLENLLKFLSVKFVWIHFSCTLHRGRFSFPHEQKVFKTRDRVEPFLCSGKTNMKTHAGSGQGYKKAVLQLYTCNHLQKYDFSKQNDIKLSALDYTTRSTCPDESPNVTSGCTSPHQK